MEKKETIMIKHLPTGETRLINASRFNSEIHELEGKKVKKTPVIEAKEEEKIEIEEVILDSEESVKKVENECKECGQICKSAAGLKMHMKKHDK